MLYIWELINKFDLKQTTRVLHTGAQRFLRNPAPWTMYLTQLLNWKKNYGKQHATQLLLKKWRSATAKSENTENVKLHESEIVLLLQKIQSPARGMQNQDSR